MIHYYIRNQSILHINIIVHILINCYIFFFYKEMFDVYLRW